MKRVLSFLVFAFIVKEYPILVAYDKLYDNYS